MSGSNILFVLSGSIACYKACEVISRLVQRGHRVQSVATESALRIVGSAPLEGLTRERVATDLFADGRALEHISLARWAETLRGWGVRFVDVGEGRTACGETGEGRLAEPDEIVRAIEVAPVAVTPRLP